MKDKNYLKEGWGINTCINWVIYHKFTLKDYNNQDYNNRSVPYIWNIADKINISRAQLKYRKT